MPPFVTSRNQNQSNKPIPKDFNYEVSLLVMAKRMGLSFDELNEMTLQDFMDFIEIWIGDNEEEYEATQADIDRFYSSM